MNIALLLAGGSSTRAGTNKVWATVHGQPLWTLTYQTLADHPSIHRIVVAVPKGEEFRFLPFLKSPKAQVTTGGPTRMESFKAGLHAAAPKDEDYIVDVNACSPLITSEEISAVLEAAQEHGAAAVCHPVVDTLVESSENKQSKNTYVESILGRENYRLMQTPQAAAARLLKNLSDATDLATALHAQGVQVQLLPAHPLNKKITFAEDLQTLRAKMQAPTATFLGEDSHAFSTAGQLILGGVPVPDCPALEANSDGDVLLHAIGRALAQAQNTSFSEIADPLCEAGTSSSAAYLQPLLSGLQITNLSLSLECQRPRIDPLIPALKTSLSKLLNVSTEAISISAHTGETLTSFGRGEGIRCLALLTISKNELII